MKSKLKFTGERLIPEINKGEAFFYEHLIRYLFACQFVKHKVVLDAGCGVGYGTYILSRYGNAQEAVGIDISQKAVDYAKSKYKLANVKFKKGNLEELAYVRDKSIEIIVGFEVIEHLQNQEKFLMQVKRIIKNEGIFIVSTPNKFTQPRGNLFHTKELYPQELFLLLKKNFKHVEVFHQAFEFAEIIKAEREKTSFSLKENFVQTKRLTYTPPPDLKKTQYLLAVCSDKKIPQVETLIMATKKADGYNMNLGFISLNRQIADLHSKILNLTQQLEGVKNELSMINGELLGIKSAKFYKLWKFYHKIKRFVVK